MAKIELAAITQYAVDTSIAGDERLIVIYRREIVAMRARLVAFDNRTDRSPLDEHGRPVATLPMHIDRIENRIEQLEEGIRRKKAKKKSKGEATTEEE